MFHRIQCMISCVSNDIRCVATFYSYKSCDICDSKGDTFKYGLTTLETPVATLITLLRLQRGLWAFEREETCCGRCRVRGHGRVRGRVLLLPSPFILLCFLFLCFWCVFSISMFGYFGMVVCIHLHSIVYDNWHCVVQLIPWMKWILSHIESIISTYCCYSCEWEGDMV